MCADFMHLERDVLEMRDAGVDYYHLDVMDGHFVDNITLGFDCCRYLAAYSIPRDIHLLVNNPENHINKFELQKGDIFQVHYESAKNIRQIAEQVHAAKSLMGVVLNPKTSPEVLLPYLDCIDIITLMMITPGFAGKPMEHGMLEKIAKTRLWLDQLGYTQIIIEVDGNVNTNNTPIMYQNGATIVVAGSSSIFRKDISITEGVRQLRQCVARSAV